MEDVLGALRTHILPRGWLPGGGGMIKAKDSKSLVPTTKEKMFCGVPLMSKFVDSKSETEAKSLWFYALDFISHNGV